MWAAEEGDGPTNVALLRAHGESGSGGRSATDVDVRLQAGFAQTFGHGQAHEADSDKSNTHDGLRLHQ